jgi:hypothetical protein
MNGSAGKPVTAGLLTEVLGSIDPSSVLAHVEVSEGGQVSLWFRGSDKDESYSADVQFWSSLVRFTVDGPQQITVQ